MSSIKEDIQFKKMKASEVLLSEPNKLRLIRELEMHQMELELQNEELRLAKRTTELAEKKYKELYDFSPSGYLTLSKEGEIISLNSSAEDILGKERSSLIQSSFGFFVSSDTRAVFNNFIQQIFKTNLKQSCELKLVGSDDSIKYVLAHGIASNISEKCLVTLVDISKRKFAENELIKAKEKAEEGDRLKSAFLANMSHEIRTPMNGILGFAELLTTLNLSGEKQQEFINIIQRSGVRMLNIINDIISISKIESQQIEVLVSTTNINEQIEYIYHFFRLEAEQKKLHLSVHPGLSSVNAFIQTDREKIYSVLTNLVKNAIKFTPAGLVELGYEVKGEFLEFYVKDTGHGISEEQKQFIFDRFRQGGQLTAGNSEGSGLGLAISKAYVEMLGGKLWVESKIGQGSTFRFTIPYVNGLQENDPLQTMDEKAMQANRKLKILIVDDDEISRMLFQRMIEPSSGNYFQAINGVEAIEACRQNPGINLVLMDINMPGGINGYEATRQIREFNKEVVIIAQTAYVLPEVRKKAMEAGCNDYISKPISQNELHKMINSYFQN